MNDVAVPRPPLDPSRLADLAPRWRVEVLAVSASTNAEAADRVRAGAGAGLVLVAEHQQAGRGRMDRVWETPERAALTFSAVVDPGVPAAQWPLLPLLVGLVVETSVADRVPEARLKWPNDVMTERPGDDGFGRKLCGILVERVEGPNGPLAVVGIGVNVSQGRDEMPDTGTSVRLEVEAEIAAEQQDRDGDEDPSAPRETVVVDRTELLATLLRTLDALAPLLAAPDDLVNAYRSVCSTLGREVDVHLPGGRVHRGTALDLDSSGALVVADGPGTLTVTAGDVVHVRRAG